MVLSISSQLALAQEEEILCQRLEQEKKNTFEDIYFCVDSPLDTEAKRNTFSDVLLNKFNNITNATWFGAEATNRGDK